MSEKLGQNEVPQDSTREGKKDWEKMGYHCEECARAAHGVKPPERKIDSEYLRDGTRVDGTGKVYLPEKAETLRLACDPSKYVATSGRLGGER